MGISSIRNGHLVIIPQMRDTILRDSNHNTLAGGDIPLTALTQAGISPFTALIWARPMKAKAKGPTILRSFFP